MKSSVKVSFPLAMTMAMATAVAVVVPTTPASAAPSDVVISELMYHPADAADVEFLELTNRGLDPQDVSGWCLATGITLCLPDGTELAAGERIVVTDDAAGFAAIYGAGVVPIGEYTGSLSNGGETIDLLDAGGTLINTVTYDDAGDWPAAPDGAGPSLELNDLFADNTLAVNWGTSLSPTGHTVGAVNSLEGLVLPTVANMVANPARPDAGQNITVSAEVTGTNQVDVTWVVGFGDVQVTAMNDGPQSVGGANDGVWSAVLPGQAAGELVRYRVDASDGELSASLPSAGDTITYEGVVVRDPSVSSTLPILEWFMDDAVHDDLVENHRFDNVQGAAVIAYGGEVIDGVLMNIRGNSSRLDRKVNWKVEFPNGYLFDMGGLLDRPVDEFNMQRGAFPEDELVWQTAADAGLVSLQFFKMRTQRNGEFYSVASYSGVYDGTWRDAVGRDDWALYKAEQGRGRARGSAAQLAASGDWDKKEGDDDNWTDLHELTTMLDAPPTAAQRDWMWENLNVPAMINYAATVAVVRHSDSSWYNYYVTNDTFGTGRWEMYLWDLDSPFLTDASDGDGDFLTPADNGQKFMEALMAHPEFRQMYMRRFRTLIDEKLLAGFYQSQISSIVSPYAAEYNLDRARFGGRSISGFTRTLENGIDDRLRVVDENQGPDGSGLIPPSPTGNRPVVISEIEEAPAGGGEFIALRNDSATESIDLSKWTVAGAVSVTIPGGTVLLPGATGYLVADDAAFRSTNGATLFVIGEFNGSLPDAGGTLSLATASGVAVDSATFPDDDPVDPPDPVDVTFVPAGASWRYLDNVAAPSNWATPGFVDGGWSQGAAELGFGDGDEATVVGSGSVTVYFRHAFEVADPAEVSNLVASLTADDGAVMYLNGIEVARDNMPAGTITATTTASSTRFSTPERTARPFALPSSALVAGENVIAVEVHNGWAGSSDLSFNLALTGVVGDGDGGGGEGPGEVIALGDQWRYFDGGAAANNWQAAGFADGGWSQGSAEFGFGDGDESTVLVSDPLTFYFRRSFQIDDPAVVSELIAGIDADDGAVIYINGIEVARDNMPSGPVTATTPASSSRWGGANEGVVRDFNLPVGSLVAGTNVIAVEVHNRWYTSSDLSFDLRLTAN